MDGRLEFAVRVGSIRPDLPPFGRAGRWSAACGNIFLAIVRLQSGTAIAAFAVTVVIPGSAADMAFAQLNPSEEQKGTISITCPKGHQYWLKVFGKSKRLEPAENFFPLAPRKILSRQSTQKKTRPAKPPAKVKESATDAPN